MSTAPRSRNDFEVAIVCALPLEFDAVALLLDQTWSEKVDRYGRASGDRNRYVTGRMGDTNVVVLLLAKVGKASAARATEGLRFSFPRVRLVLLTGTCGGAPATADGDEVLLGDVIISKSIVQHDFGRSGPDGFAAKDEIEDLLGPLPRDLLSLVVHLETFMGRSRLEASAHSALLALQKAALARQKASTYDYPGVRQDRLFAADYVHKHGHTSSCAQGVTDSICEPSCSLTCQSVGCDDAFEIGRERTEAKRQLEREGRDWEAQAPRLHVGRFGSGDMVVRCGKARDRLIEQHTILGFEMEGAGIWGELPCLVIKGVCNYADSHANKAWRGFAAATAASATKAFLDKYAKTNAPAPVLPDDGEPCWNTESASGASAMHGGDVHFSDANFPNYQLPRRPADAETRALQYQLDAEAVGSGDLADEMNIPIPLVDENQRTTSWGLVDWARVESHPSFPQGNASTVISGKTAEIGLDGPRPREAPQ
ncbi:hypothetical protein VDGD_09488 [Verticillium dahliae]|nr:hypothetical protein VDGD_09488 [Verticillium dahliae]